MLNVNLDEGRGVLLLEPQGALSAEDFVRAAAIVDPFLERNGVLHGIIIHVRAFPGWDSFAALISHFRFVRDHHKRVERVAFATDSALGEAARHIAAHFVSAEIDNFSYDELEQARRWVTAGD